MEAIAHHADHFAELRARAVERALPRATARSTSSAQRFGERRDASRGPCARITAPTSRRIRPRRPMRWCFPQSTDEVVAIVRACARHGVPMIPFGTGTSVEGHVLATHGGVCIDLSQMNRIARGQRRAISTCASSPASRASSSTAYLHDSGLFFPIDPGADASLGGMASTRASGTNAVRYGTMRENVLGAHRRARRRPRDPDRRARAQVGGRLRPHAPLRRRGRHARHHHRAHAAAVCDSRRHVGRGVRLSDGEGGRGFGDRGDPVRHSDRARRAPRHAHGQGGQSRTASSGCPKSPTLWYEFHGTRARRRRAGDADAGDRARAWRRRLRVGDAAGRAHAACGRRATMPTSRACSCARAAA